MDMFPRVGDAGVVQEDEAGGQIGADPEVEGQNQVQDRVTSIDALEEEDAAGRLVREAGAMLRSRVGNVPPDFVTWLFGGAAPEDLVHYEAAEIAEIAEATCRFLAERQPQTRKIRIGLPQSASGARLNNVSIVEILNDDMPFLVDSVMAELTAQGFEAHLLLHPRFIVERDAGGALVSLSAATTADQALRRESLIQVHIDRIDSESTRNALVIALDNVLADVRRAVDDWKPMLDRVNALITEMTSAPPERRIDDLGESVAFLQWLMDDNFTFLGVRDYAGTENGDGPALLFSSALGILRGREGDAFAADGGRLALTPRAVEALREPTTLIITKTNSRSRVHRRSTMDYVVVKRRTADGELDGGIQIVGLFTSSAYISSTSRIPWLRRKVANVVARSALDPTSHSGRALANLLQTYPRDELFQIDEDTLLKSALTILQLNERPRVRVLPRRDAFDRFVSVLVYVPQDRYDATACAAIGEELARAFDGKLASFVPFFLEGPMVRVHFMIARKEGTGRPAELGHPPRRELEAAVTRLVKTWADELLEALEKGHDPVHARYLFSKYGRAFSPAYREAFGAAVVVDDIAAIESLSSDAPLSVDFQPAERGYHAGANLKVWSFGRPIPLSERVPVLEHMGFVVVDESTYNVETRNGGGHVQSWLHAMQLARRGGDIVAAKPRLDACFAAVLRGDAENDGYNALVLAAGFGWREVALVRAISRYLRQLRVPYSQDYMWTTLVRHATITEKIGALFAARFDPDLALPQDKRNERQAAIATEIEGHLKNVASLDEDRIIRHFVNVVQSTVRTNFYQAPPEEAAAGRAVAIKLDSRKVDGMPRPRPQREIFVCSPRLEAVHLRFGPVARGGIRWSDRPQDFRTEILGLVKAQQVKNAVIVPVGAKGGFVPKRLPTGNRDAIQAEAIAVYKIFMSTLLDLTDNLDRDGVVPPERVIRYDGDDPYLVVAADKGTATFSDIANEIAKEHGFWLDDAFASGGSAGYDHKKMGITARGAWESVKRHFREVNTDIARTPFSVVGVGDMSGDVFGNGMLRERTIRLIAAFDHRDIFIDPDPDPERSFAERRRLFDLPRSSWQDYDRSVLSPGGGVFPRTAKEIDLSPQARAALGVSVERATPQEVMNAILKAPVDLMWFGGIGTYVRASAEADDAVGDRANDAIRATAAELRCRVIGEGGNLGMTQRARIEAGLRGIRLNNDAIDNSAGVNTSDVEVNLKIALSVPLRDGRLTRGDRDIILAGMTDEVARLVLRNNYQQTLALSLIARRGLEDLGFQRLMQVLEQRQLLDRKVEFLPSDAEIAERRRHAQPLTRPELAVLSAYAKLALHEDLLNSDVPDDPYLARELTRYFPQSIWRHFPDAFEHHRLRRDIIATQLANSMINRAGAPVVVRLADQTGASVDRIVRAFAAVRDSYRLTALNTSIEGLDNKVSGDVQLELYTASQNLLLDRIVWFLRNVDVRQRLAGLVDHYRAKIAAVSGGLDGYLTPEAKRSRDTAIQKMTSDGVPQTIASHIANLPLLRSATDIVLISDRTVQPVAQVAATYYAAEAHFQLDRIVAAARDIKLADYFDRLAFDRGFDAMGDALRRLVAEMTSEGGSGAEAVAAFAARKGGEVDRVRDAIHAMVASGLSLSKLTVAASLLGDLARG